MLMRLCVAGWTLPARAALCGRTRFLRCWLKAAASRTPRTSGLEVVSKACSHTRCACIAIRSQVIASRRHHNGKDQDLGMGFPWLSASSFYSTAHLLWRPSTPWETTYSTRPSQATFFLERDVLQRFFVHADYGGTERLISNTSRVIFDPPPPWPSTCTLSLGRIRRTKMSSSIAQAQRETVVMRDRVT